MKLSASVNNLGSKIVLLLSILVMAACANQLQSKTNETHAQGPAKSNLATLYRWELKDNSIWFLTRSTGCTNKQHFRLEAESSPSKTDDTLLVSIVRVKRDLCKAMPRTIAFELPLTSPMDKNQKVIVTNPVSEKPKKSPR